MFALWIQYSYSIFPNESHSATAFFVHKEEIILIHWHAVVHRPLLSPLFVFLWSVSLLAGGTLLVLHLILSEC